MQELRLTVPELEEKFEEYLDWLNETNGRIYILDENNEPTVVMISAQEARELGLDLGEDETGTD